MQCKAITNSGNRCKRKGTLSGFCFQHTLYKKNTNKYSFKKVWTLIFSIGALLIFIGDIFDLFDLGKPWNQLFSQLTQNEIGFSKNTSFQIAILPFFPTKNCTIEDTDYENQLLIRMKELDFTDNGLSEVVFFSKETCPFNDGEALAIAKKVSADLIIWGYYDEECEEEDKIRIKYNLIDTNYMTQKFSSYGDSGFKSISEELNLSNGTLQKDIEYLLFWIGGHVYFQSGELEKSLEYFDEIEGYECDDTIFSYKLGVTSSVKYASATKILDLITDVTHS